MAFTKYPKLCQLEALHGVDLGTNYRNDVACHNICHFISQYKHQSLSNELTKVNFFLLSLDGSTDCSNVENVMFLTVYCDTNASDEKVHSKITYLTVDHPSSATGEGQFASLEKVLRDLGFPSLDTDACRKLISVGTDGAAANIARRGLKGLVEAKLDCIFWVWCLAHRLELINPFKDYSNLRNAYPENPQVLRNLRILLLSKFLVSPKPQEVVRANTNCSTDSPINNKQNYLSY